MKTIQFDHLAVRRMKADEGGSKKWKEAGLPVERSTTRHPSIAVSCG